MTATRYIGQPPSPPQSLDGEPGPDPQMEPCRELQLYAHPAALGAPRPDLMYDGSSGQQQLPYGSCPSPYYLSECDYPVVPMRHPMVAHGLQVNTPPPTADDVLASGSLGPVSPIWSSPGAPRRSTPKTKSAKASKPKRKSTKARSKTPEVKVHRSLSEQLKHLTHIPIRDMEAHVHRPIEVRREELIKKKKANKKKGGIPRPMNSFMLYRSAYTERVKKFYQQNNHQIVSSIAGQGWKQEPREIREKYERLASIEKKHHGEAHPTYKFSPNKSEKERKTPVPEEADPSHTPSSSPFFYARGTSTEIDSSGWDSRDSTPFDIPEHGMPLGASFLSSSWSTPPSRPMSGMTSSPESKNYFQPSIHPSIMGSQVEDLRFKQAELQDLQYGPSTTLAGIPGGNHHDLLQPQTTVPVSGAGNGGQMDPQLLSFHSTTTDDGSPVYSHPPYHVWQEAPTSNCYLPGPPLTPSPPPYPVSSSYQTGMQAPVDGRQAWESHHEAGPEATGGEFDHWINPHASGY